MLFHFYNNHYKSRKTLSFRKMALFIMRKFKQPIISDYHPQHTNKNCTHHCDNTRIHNKDNVKESQIIMLTNDNNF